MKSGFMNEPSDVQWLKETHLNGVPLPMDWLYFQSYVLQGNEGAPHAVNLYKSQDPLYSDAYYRVEFKHGAPIYCIGCQYDGLEQGPKVLTVEARDGD